jgi:hypothetical protein
MARTTATASAYRYSPGDGRTYTWDGAAEYAVVHRHQYSADQRLSLVPTGDIVPTAGIARTAQALMAAVDEWRHHT